MKRHKFVTMTSQFGNLDYILRFERTITREIRLPAPLLFDNTRRNGWSFNEIQFDEFMANYQPITPWRGLCPMRSMVSSHLSRERPSPSMARDLLLLGARGL